MQYKIIVDKHPRTNPSSDKKQYVIDIEELRYLDDVYDTLIITKDADYVIRRLSLSEYGVLSVLSEEVIEPIGNINIELFEGDNYIYLADMTGNYIYAEYLLKNEFTDMYITEAEMNTKIQQTYNSIELSVNQKLTSYSTIEELTNAKNEAIDTANSNTDEKLKNYTTTIDMQGKIEASALSVITEVSRTYSTKKETNDAKDEAINTANSDTDDKLKDYYTIEQTIGAITTEADRINLELEKKVDGEKITGANIILAINNDNTSDIAINADKINIDGKATKFKTNISTTIGPFTSDDVTKMQNYLLGTGELTSEELQKYDINLDGEINSLDLFYAMQAVRKGGYDTFTGTFEIDPYSANKTIKVFDNKTNSYDVILSLLYNYVSNLYTSNLEVTNRATIKGNLSVSNSSGRMFTQESDGGFELITEGKITCEVLTQTSIAEKKKNFEKLENALDIVKGTDIYKYNLKTQKDGAKKHIGFVIGDGYNYSREITSEKNDGADIYSMTAVLYKAVQEQQETIENLLKRIERLEEKNGIN